MKLDHFKQAMEQLPPGVRQASIDIQRESCTWAQIGNGTLLGAGSSTQYGVFAFAGNTRIGTAYTQNILEEPAQLLRKAAENSLALDGEKPFFLNAPRQTCQPWQEHLPHPALLLELGSAIEKQVAEKVRFPLEITVELRQDTMSSRVFNSRGLDVSASNQFYSATVYAAAQDGTRQVNAVAAQTAAEPGQLNPAYLGARLEYALERQFQGEKMAPGRYAAVLDSSVAINILTTAWQLFSGIKYADGTSALAGTLGSPLFSPALSLTDTPRRQGTGYAYGIDCEGSLCEPVTLVENGRFSGLMHTLASAHALGCAPTGNAGRRALLTGAIPTAVIPVPRIACIEPGHRSQSQLLQAMGEGVLVSESYDVFHSVNITSGDFSIPCRGALVEKGQIKNNVTEMTLSGNLLDLFASVEEAGSDLELQEFLLKSYCIGAPSLRLSSLQING